MKLKGIAVAAASVAALSLAAAPIAVAASTATHHRAPVELRFDRSRDLTGKKHVETSRDRTPDPSRDIRDR